MNKRNLAIAEQFVKLGLATGIYIAAFREKHGKKNGWLFNGLLFSILVMQRLSNKRYELECDEKDKPQAATAIDLDDIPDEDLPGLDEMIAEMEKEIEKED